MNDKLNDYQMVIENFISDFRIYTTVKKIKCSIHDPDRISKEIISEFVGRSSDTVMVKDKSTLPDVIFIDSDLSKIDLNINGAQKPQVVIVSSNQRYVHSVLKEQVADFLLKPHLSYPRFLKAIEKVKAKLKENS